MLFALTINLKIVFELRKRTFFWKYLKEKKRKNFEKIVPFRFSHIKKKLTYLVFLTSTH